MRRRFIALLFSALLVLSGTALANPASTPEEAENGCQGINEARDYTPEAADDALDMVEEILAGDDGCDDRRPGDAGQRP